MKAISPQKSLLIAVKGRELTSLEGCWSCSCSIYLGSFKQDMLRSCYNFFV